MKRIGWCIPITGFTEEEKARRRAIIERWLPNDVALDIVAIEGGPRFVDQRSDFGTVEKAGASFLATIDPDRYDVLISAGAIDPGLDTLRAASPVPVIGPGEAGMFLAALIGRPLSIVTIDEHAVAVAKDLVAHLRVKPQIVSIRSIEMPARVIVDELDRAREATKRESRAAVREDGARAVYLGAMTLGTLGVEESLRRELKVPIINPIEVALATAVQCLRARA